MPNQPLRRKLFETLWAPQVKPVLERLPLVRRIYSGWGRVHPFDAAHGIDASGYMPAAECAGDSPLAGQINPYGGSQPSIVRAVLASLPDVERYAFVDIGCGKGRPLVVASEFAFRRVVGVELAPQLAAVARSNAAAVAAQHPTRTAIEIQVGDATQVAPPAPCTVYFLYNSFDQTLVTALIENLERQLEDRLEHVFFVYYNPVHSAVLDASQRFARWSARTLPYAPEELGYGPDIEDTVLIWQSLPQRYPAQADAGRAVSIGPTGWSSLVAAT